MIWPSSTRSTWSGRAPASDSAARPWSCELDETTSSSAAVPSEVSVRPAHLRPPTVDLPPEENLATSSMVPLAPSRSTSL